MKVVFPGKRAGLLLAVWLVLTQAFIPNPVFRAAFAQDSAQAQTADVSAAPPTAFAAVFERIAAPLRAAIQDLIRNSGRDYPGGARFLERLESIERQVRAAPPDKIDGLRAQYEALCREALIANPLVSGHPILFVVRKQYRPDHHNTATFFPSYDNEYNNGSYEGGGALKAIHFGNAGRVQTLLELPEGIIRDPDVYFDGSRVVFAKRDNAAGTYHIFEANADGTGLRQLTSAGDVTDLDPLYLPDGSIVFTSTREPKYCMCNRHIMGNLYRMDSDGANIQQIGKSTLHEGHGALMPDGRILYDRWEYVDRNFGDAQGLWTVNPDGTNHALYWGNNTTSPGSVLDGRVIPGAERVLCVFATCHDRPWGALAIVDRGLGMDGRAPVVWIRPEQARDLVTTEGKDKFDDFGRVPLKYEDPYPLNDKYFLCSRMTGQGEQTAIYLLDVFGNEIPLHQEGPGCFDPMPLSPRPRPPVIPTRRNYRNEEGSFYVLDVYRGTHMQGVKRGDVKYLRVVESPEKRSWTLPAWAGQGTIAPAMNWHDFNNKRILGTVPVEEDGSAYFSVPSDTFVYFQLLDKNKMMIQSMRSGTMVQSGESAGCTGCHEDRRTAPPAAAGTRSMPQALRRAPGKLEGWYGEPRLFSYMAEVQPVFNRSCVECHDFGKEGGKKLVLAPDKTETFNASYNELWRKGLIKCVGAGPAQTQQAYSWGSHASRIVEVLRAGHQDLQLDTESMERITTWIDINAPYYPSYMSAYPDNLAGRSPLDDPQLSRLGELTGIPFLQQASFSNNPGPLISFDRPELSPCLAKFSERQSPGCREALGIIESGKVMLQNRPRADMEGFVPCPADQKREEKYARRRSIELRSRAAIRNNEKVYDSALE